MKHRHLHIRKKKAARAYRAAVSKAYLDQDKRTARERRDLSRAAA